MNSNGDHRKDHPGKPRNDNGINNNGFNIDFIVDELLSDKTYLTDPLKGKIELYLPSRERIKEVVELLRAVMFPGYYGSSEIAIGSRKFHLGATIDHISRILKEQILRGLCFECDTQDTKCVVCQERASKITYEFLKTLPKVKYLLSTDVIAAYEGDPAAKSTDEVIFCYPCIIALTNYRIAHELYKLEVPIIPRIITEMAHSLTGIDIHPGATIDEKFFIDHGTGVVIGETTIIGKNVRLYQGVTLGAKSFPLDENGNPIKGIPRHPIIEDNVIIYSGATILGRVTIGKNSVIGGNVWLTKSVPPNSFITQSQYKEEVYSDGGGI